MNRMVLLYTLILCMVSLPTILPKRFLVETEDNQEGDDYDAPMNPPLMDYSMGQQNKGKLFKIPWSFIQLDSSSQFYLYRNFIHLLFPDQVKIFFGQYN